MNFRLVDAGWNEVLDNALCVDNSDLRIVCPFIKKRATERLLKRGKPATIQVITRFNLGDFYAGVSDTTALRLLLDNGAKIRGVRNLHAKLYLFGGSSVIVTSANLSEAALLRNHEFGFVAENREIITRCRDYFEDLWKRSGSDLTHAQLDAWEKQLTDVLAKGSRPSMVTGLSDEGVNAGVATPPVIVPPLVAEASQSFVKFFGEGHRRSESRVTVFEEVKRSGCHWACTYPKGKRPRQVEDGAVIFMARMMKEPTDIVVYGRAVAMHHEKGRDDASPLDIQLRPWKERWPYYVRVHHAEFVAGTLKNGVSLSILMDSLGANAFYSTQQNAAKGSGNTDPRGAYRQQASVRLSQQGHEWLNEMLEKAFETHGKLTPTELEQLDWPTNSVN